jgi:hypothetical protein
MILICKYCIRTLFNKNMLSGTTLDFPVILDGQFFSINLLVWTIDSIELECGLTLLTLQRGKNKKM